MRPDMAFQYADDLLRPTWLDYARVAFGSVVFALFAALFMLLLSFAGPA